jgi:SAM-dependent methyltransferase
MAKAKETDGGSRDRSYWTAQRARMFNLALQASDFPAQTLKALEPALTGCRSALDVGAGVGALTLLLAKRLPRVTALEPSPAMLEELQANLARSRLDNVACVQAAWGKDAVPPHDLVLVANVAPLFDSLLPFLAEAGPLARQAIALVQNVGPGHEKFYAGELYPLLLGKPHRPRTDYLGTVSLLHSLDIYANVQIIDYQFDQPFDEFAEAIQFWKEYLHLETAEQERRLVTFLEGRLARVGDRWIAPMRRRSAVIWWRVSGR